MRRSTDKVTKSFVACNLVWEKAAIEALVTDVKFEWLVKQVEQLSLEF